MAPMTVSEESLVQLSNVRIDRGGRTILRDVSLTVPRGSITAVLGPSGSGKSTLLAALTGELRPVAGEVTLFGQPIPTGARALLEMRKTANVVLGAKASVNDWIVKASAMALVRHPDVNVQVHGTEIHRFPHADVSIAVAGPNPRSGRCGSARRCVIVSPTCSCAAS